MRLSPPLVVAATVASLLILPTTAALLRAIDVLWPAALRDSWGATPATWIALFWRLTLGGILAVLTWPLAYVAARYDLVRTFRTLEILVVAVALLVTVQGLLLP